MLRTELDGSEVPAHLKPEVREKERKHTQKLLAKAEVNDGRKRLKD
jgi:hypothetical protein